MIITMISIVITKSVVEIKINFLMHFVCIHLETLILVVSFFDFLAEIN